MYFSEIYYVGRKENSTLSSALFLAFLIIISENDIYHSYRNFDIKMLPWIEKIKEGESFHKDIIFIQFFNVCFDFSQLFLVTFLAALESNSVDNPYVSQFLILPVHFIPFFL